ncbi:hypothetical protein P691DRAFT_253632 [Macrolepiota fuliginosa MF-IS2]|uniref:Uncharacterized protein n=1 Tax=Macrolepiota fuliginosa MF-IS2 TaxID=1400762 RepID=A0A9P5X8P0_9AGAR|nr:hypothetical protein P691DRAFT_253632 [Macrolepiota fuliginosa MF-IS2]
MKPGFFCSLLIQPLTAVQVATAQSHLLNLTSKPQLTAPPAQISQVVQRAAAPTQAPQPPPQNQSVLPPQAHHHQPAAFTSHSYSAYSANADTRHRADSMLSGFMMAVIKKLEDLPQLTTDALVPKFTALQNEVDTLKASFSEVKGEVAELKEGVQAVVNTHKASHSATTEALKDFAEKAESLEAFFGESELGYEGDRNRTVMGRLDEIYLALGDVFEKMADHEADGSSVFLCDLRHLGS